jgi:hypothetical protein
MQQEASKMKKMLIEEYNLTLNLIYGQSSVFYNQLAPIYMFS